MSTRLGRGLQRLSNTTFRCHASVFLRLCCTLLTYAVDCQNDSGQVTPCIRVRNASVRASHGHTSEQAHTAHAGGGGGTVAGRVLRVCTRHPRNKISMRCHVLRPLRGCLSRSDGDCHRFLRRRGTGKQSDLQMYGTSKLYGILAVKEMQKRIGEPKGELHGSNTALPGMSHPVQGAVDWTS